MNGRPLSSEIKDGLQALDEIRTMQGPFVSERLEQQLHHVETLLRHLLHLLSEKHHARTDN